MYSGTFIVLSKIMDHSGFNITASKDKSKLPKINGAELSIQAAYYLHKSTLGYEINSLLFQGI